MLFGVVSLGLALLVGPGAAQDAKKEGHKDGKGSIAPPNKPLQIPDDQTKRIQAIDVERKKLRALRCRAEYMLFKRELIEIESWIRETDTALSVARTQLKANESNKIPQNLIEEFVDAHPIVQEKQYEIARLRDRIQNHQGRPKRFRQMEQALRDASAHLRMVKASVQPEVEQQLQKRLHRQLVGRIQEIEEFLKVLNEKHAKVFKEMNHHADQWAMASIAAADLERQLAEMEKADLKASKKKDPEKE
jgi:hypothetical protein